MADLLKGYGELVTGQIRIDSLSHPMICASLSLTVQKPESVEPLKISCFHPAISRSH
jgi:hypothetical protein